MKILALNPPFLPKYSRESRSPAVTRSGTLYYPLWLSYAVGYLEKHGHDVRFLDAPAADMDREGVIRATDDFQPSMAVLDTSTPSIYNDITIAEELKKAVPGLFTVLVGVHVSALPEQTLTESKTVDAVAYGEYDATLVALAEVLESGRDDAALATVKGLAFRDSSGTIRKNPAREYLQDLDAIPFVSEVYHRHLSTEPYFYGHSRHPLVVLVTGRGCPFHCTYCVVPQTLQGHRYRKRSVVNVAEEFKYINDNFPEVREIMIEDDTLTADRKRCRELSKLLIEMEATRIPWSANSRADVDYETMRVMKKAGCRLFCVGFESGDQQILDNIKKGTRLGRIRAFVKDARRAGILVHGCFMVGNRGETPETLEQTLRFAKELNPDTAQFYPIMVYPGTSDYDYFRSKGWVVTENYREWLTEEGLHSSVVSNPDLKYEHLVEFCDRARKEFYLRPRYVGAKLLQIVTHPSEAKRIIKAGRTFLRYQLRPQSRREQTTS
jgi:radical SAM superfamily enzyme YgiQ (UPF0313 family)